VSGTFPPRKYGGITNVSYNTAKRMVARGHEVVVYTTDVGNDSYSRLNVKDSLVFENIRVHYFKNISNKLAFKHRILLPLGIIPFINNKKSDFQIIHLNGYRNILNMVISRYAHKNNIPYVIQTHGSIPRIMEKKRIKWFFDVLFGYEMLRNASKVIALNETEHQQYRGINISDEKIEVIPNGIDLSDYKNLPPRGLFKQKYGIKKGERMILYLARIHKIKGVDVLVNAFAMVLKKLGDVKLVIVGPDEGYREELDLLVKKLNINDKVLLIGPLYDNDKREAFIDSYVYILPSRYETFPMSLLEAYACCRPVIASRIGGLKHLVIDGVTGLLFESENTEQLAKSLQSMLKDDVKTENMGKKGRQFVEMNFDIEKVIDQFEEIYNKLISGESIEDK